MAGKKVGIAVVGCGRMGAIHAAYAAKCPEAQLVAVFDRNGEKARALAQRYDVKLVAKRQSDVLRSGDVHAVVIALPSHQRRKPVISALRAGKHVFTEKPFSLRCSDADAMIKEAVSSGRILVSGQVLRFTEAFRKARQMIQAGKVGKVLQIVHRRLSLIQNPIVPWWNASATRNCFIIHHHGSHSIDLLLWMLDTRATYVFALALSSPGYQYEDTASILMNTEAGVPVSISESFRSHREAHDALIIGSKSTIEIQETSNLFVNGKPVKIREADCFQRQLKAFVKAIKHNQYPKELTLESVRNGVAAMDAAIKSCVTGKSVAVRN